MKKQTVMSTSGVQIENTLSMALHRRGSPKYRASLLVLAVLGTLSVLMTFVTMFTPQCNIFITLAFSLGVLVFFAFHAEQTNGTHYTLLLFLLGYAIFFYWKREDLAAGLMYLMNDIYKAIYLTDWDYFQTNAAFDPQQSITMTLCFAMVPITWLLSYAVLRYQNAFLGFLATFPFVELGLFFGVVPDHLAMAGLFAFWCALAAVQLASGTSAFRKDARTGFLRKKAVFIPVSRMRFLLPERAGLWTMIAVFLLCLAAEYGLQKTGYERPDSISEMRTDFQYYAASIDWDDLSSLLPFLNQKKEGEPEEVIELGRTERREFENKVVSSIQVGERPLCRTYLKFSTYQTYDKSRWKTISPQLLDTPEMQMFSDVRYYPSEFLYYAVQSLGYEQTTLSILDPNETLLHCVPYGFAEQARMQQQGDLILTPGGTDYTVFCGEDYENLLLNTVSYDVPAITQLEICPENDQETLSALLQGHEEELVQFPLSSTAQEAVYYGDMDALARRAEAAVLSACGYTDLVYSAYTEVPDTEDMEVVHRMFGDILDGFDARAATPSETMILLSRIRERLCANVEYSLSPGRTPPGEDYIRYFLTQNRRGYCTHYATAGTIIARMAGIPARYCEGYLVEKETFTEDEEEMLTAQLLDSNAHAWTEIYIDGFGWIPFEFTFSYFTPPELPTEPETEETTEEISEDPTEERPETQTETTIIHIPPETTPRPTEAPTPVPQETHLGLIFAVLGAMLFIVGIIMAFVLARRYALNKRFVKLSDPIGDASAQYAWQLLLQGFAYCGVNTQAGSTDALLHEVREKCRTHLPAETLDEVLRIGTKLRYSPHHLKDEEREMLLHALYKLLESIYAQASPPKKFYLKWVKHYV